VIDGDAQSTKQRHSWGSLRPIAIGVVAALALGFTPGVVSAGPPSAEAATPPAVTRLSGADRYATAVKISESGFPAGASTVYLVTGADYPDALSAAPAAAAADAPLLLTPAATLPAAVSAEITRLKPTTVVILGGESIVSKAVATAVTSLGAAVTRIAGADRYDTSRQLAAHAFPAAEKAYVATGANYPDALAASAAAGSIGAPVVLVDGKKPTLPEETATTLSPTTTVTIAGGTAVVSAGIEAAIKQSGKIVERRAGTDRYLTAVAINKAAFPAAPRVHIANGASFADALAGAALAGSRGNPLYLSAQACVGTAVASDITARLHATEVTLLGGPGVLHDRVGTLVDCAAAKKGSETTLAARLNAEFPRLPGSYAVSVREQSGLGVAVSIRGADMKEPASTMKLFAVYAALKRIDQGRLWYSSRTSSGTTVADCMRVAIHISDNPCHHELMALMGTTSMNRQFAAEGYSRTHYAGTVNGTFYSSKTSSTNDLALLLSRLNSGKLLSAASTKYMVTLMKTQLWKNRIAVGLPPKVLHGSKIGLLWVSTGVVQNDAAIVYAPNGTYVLSVLGSRNATKAGIARISRIVYEHFNGSFGAAASYPVVNMYAKKPVVLYSRPGSGTLRTLAYGTKVEAIDSVRTWYRVRVGSQVGYINSSGLGNRY
jgi:putative cell wall-binding protein/beta-lactamase class A